jgi:hypothetical protein
MLTVSFLTNAFQTRIQMRVLISPPCLLEMWLKQKQRSLARRRIIEKKTNFWNVDFTQFNSEASPIRGDCMLQLFLREQISIFNSKSALCKCYSEARSRKEKLRL